VHIQLRTSDDVTTLRNDSDTDGIDIHVSLILADVSRRVNEGAQDVVVILPAMNASISVLLHSALILLLLFVNRPKIELSLLGRCIKRVN
jgi:hypothetical protein